jgi:hypothetical protein
MQINTNNDTYAPSYSSSYTKVSTTGAGAGSDGSIQAGGGNQASNNTTPPLEPKGSFPDTAPRNGGVFDLRDGTGNKYAGVGEGGYTSLPTPQVPPNVPVQTVNPSGGDRGFQNVNAGFLYGDHGFVPDKNLLGPVDTTGTVGQGFDGLIAYDNSVKGGYPPQGGQKDNYHPNNVGFLPSNPPRQYFQFQDNYVQPVQVWHTQPSVNFYPEKNEVNASVKDGKVIDFADLYIPKDGKYSRPQLNFINAYNKYINPHG